MALVIQLRASIQFSEGNLARLQALAELAEQTALEGCGAISRETTLLEVSAGETGLQEQAAAQMHEAQAAQAAAEAAQQRQLAEAARLAVEAAGIQEEVIHFFS